MKAYYSILTQGESLIYKGLIESATNAAIYCEKIGIPMCRENVSELANGKRWSNKVIIIRHLVDEEVLITPTLLKDLRLKGERVAERLLKNRNKTKR